MRVEVGRQGDVTLGRQPAADAPHVVVETEGFVEHDDAGVGSRRVGQGIRVREASPALQEVARNLGILVRF